PAFFFQDGVRDSDLANVVEKSGNLELIQITLRGAELTGHADSPFGQASAVHSGCEIAKIEQLIEGTDHRLEQKLLLLFQCFHPEPCESGGDLWICTKFFHQGWHAKIPRA